MHDSSVCPYYGQNEDACDVGCGYITSHDATMIIKFCSAQYQGCQKYRELATKRVQSSSNLRSKRTPVAAAPPESLGLPVFGLFSLGCTSATFALEQLPMFNFNLQVLALIFLLGAIGQIGSGLSSLKKNPLRAVAFTGFGLFWLSLLAIEVLPRAGFGQMPGTLPKVGYFTMWAIFSMILCQGTQHLSRTCRLVFALLTAFLLALAAAYATGLTSALHAAALLGLASGLPGTLLGLRHCWHEVWHAMQLEMTRSGKAR